MRSSADYAIPTFARLEAWDLAVVWKYISVESSNTAIKYWLWKRYEMGYIYEFCKNLSLINVHNV